MSKKKFNKKELEDVFGSFRDAIISTDVEWVEAGDRVTLVNSNCEFEYDNVKGEFENDLLYYFEVSLEPIEVDFSEFVPEKSNNGGCYAYCDCRVVKVYDRTY